MRTVLLDTSALVAAMDRRQRHNQECKAAIQAVSGTLTTCDAVISETCLLLGKVPGAVNAILANIESGAIQVKPILPGGASRIAKFLQKYSELEVDFADACLVQLANELKTGDILTLDSDFRVYRWGANKPFRLLIEC